MAINRRVRGQHDSRPPADGRTASHTGLPQESVARRAYERYEERGKEPGHELEDWLEAEKDVQRGRALD